MGKGRWTAVVLGGLVGVATLAGQVLGGERGVVAVGAVAFVGIACTYWFSDRLAIRSEGATRANSTRYPHYHLIVRELCFAAELPVPALYVSPSQEPNAFASGPSRQRSMVCISQGLINTLSWDEIRVVLAHEISHIQSRDLLTGSIAAGLATSISFAANMILLNGLAAWTSTFAIPFAPSPIYGQPGFGVMGFALVMPLVAGLLSMALGRNFEFDADRGAADLLGGVEPVALVLRTLQRSAVVGQPPFKAKSSVLRLPHARWTGTKAAAGYRFVRIVSSHPTPEERIRRLHRGERLRVTHSLR